MLLLLLWCMRLRLQLLVLVLLLVLMLVLLLVLVPVPVLMPKSSPPEPAARDTTSKSIRTSSASTIPSTLVVPTIRATTRAPSIWFTFWIAVTFPFPFSHLAVLTRRHYGVTCPTCAPKPITIVLDLEPVGARTRRRLWRGLMDGVWTWPSLHLQFLL